MQETIVKQAAKPRIVIVDDEPSVIFLVEELLDQETVLGVSSGAGLEKALADEKPDLILLDVGLPDMDGFEIAARLAATPGHPPFLFLTAQDSGTEAAKGIRLGALDYIRKPFDGDELVARVRSALARAGAAGRGTAMAGSPDRAPGTERAGESGEAGRAGQPLVSPERRSTVYKSIIGSSRPIEELIALLDRAAKIDATVLLAGESGTGKELFARAFHEASGRASGPFIPINCAAVPGELAESLFFGHAKGSFTGAVADRPGWFEEARGGTLFLDEIGELAPELQGALLRVVENRRIRRLGERGERELDIRLVTATNRDLEAAVKAGRFRADLFYRLEEIPLHIPPLRERRDDIPLLIEAFLEEFERLSPKGRIELSDATIRELQARPWPGNVRELRNTIRRVVIAGGSLPPEAAGTAALETAPASPPESAHRRLPDLEREAIERAMHEAGGNVAAAAAALGLSRATLYRRLKSLGLP